MAIPASSTDVAVYPDWTDLQDTWRAADAEWLRNRSISLFANASDRTAAATIQAPMKGSLSALQNGYGAPEFYTGSGWEGVRYPNLAVTSDPTSVTLKHQGAGSGIQLADSGVNITTLVVTGTLVAPTGFLGAAGVGITLDNTGVSIQIGTKAVKLSTDASQLLINSPVSVAGTVTAPEVKTPLLTGTGAINASGAIVGATVQGGTVQLAGSQIKAITGASAITLPTDGTMQVAASLLTVNGNERVTGTLEVDGQTNFVGRPVFAFTAAGQNVPTWVAGVYAVAASTPNLNCPDGTIWISF